MAIRVGAVITRPEILSHFLKAGPFFSTFGGNNVACAAGIAVLDVIRDEDLVENARDVGAYLREGLTRLMARHPSSAMCAASGSPPVSNWCVTAGRKEPAPAETHAAAEPAARRGRADRRRRKIRQCAENPSAHRFHAANTPILQSRRIDRALARL